MTFNISEENWLENNGHVVLYIETAVFQGSSVMMRVSF